LWEELYSSPLKLKIKVEGQRDEVQLIDEDGSVLWEIKVKVFCKFLSVESLYVSFCN
jgi:hypothetical protein